VSWRSRLGRRFCICIVRVWWLPERKDASPLTLADRASDDFLTESLRAILPDTIVISEESAEAERRPLAETERFWLVDPLDGTKEFIKGTNEFTVNIALIEKGHPILGIVHAPALDLTYYGIREGGSWRARGYEPARRIHTRPAKFPGMSVVASKDHAGPMVEQLLSPASPSPSKHGKFSQVLPGSRGQSRSLPPRSTDNGMEHCGSTMHRGGSGRWRLFARWQSTCLRKRRLEKPRYNNGRRSLLQLVGTDLVGRTLGCSD
jgi:hypothetical protein